MTFLKTVFFRIIFPVLRLVVIYSPFLIFIFFVLFFKSPFGKETLKELRQLFILICLILFVGALVGAFASIHIFSGGQFFGNLFCILIIFIILCFSKEFSSFQLKKEKRILLFQFPFLLFFVVSSSYNIYNNIKLQKVYKSYSLNLYSDDYLKNITTLLNNHKVNPLGVCFMGKEDLEHYPLNAYGITGITFSGMSVKLTDDFHAVSNLSIFDIVSDTSTSFSKSLFRSFEFYNYIKGLKEKQLFTTYEDAQKGFIKDFNIEYALIYKNGTLPSGIESNIDTSYYDFLSGQRFVVFKK